MIVSFSIIDCSFSIFCTEIEISSFLLFLKCLFQTGIIASAFYYRIWRYLYFFVYISFLSFHFEGRLVRLSKPAGADPGQLSLRWLKPHRQLSHFQSGRSWHGFSRMVAGSLLQLKLALAPHDGCQPRCALSRFTAFSQRMFSPAGRAASFQPFSWIIRIYWLVEICFSQRFLFIDISLRQILLPLSIGEEAALSEYLLFHSHFILLLIFLHIRE